LGGRLLPVEQSAGRLDRCQFGLELFNGAARLGQFVDLDALDAWLQTRIDEGLALPQMERSDRDATLV
jgi:hypothetical protein